MNDGKLVNANAAVSRIGDGATVAITGSGGGLLEPDALLQALEQRYLTTGSPRDLTVVHAQGIGDGRSTGLNRIAHEGLVRRVIGAHWTWSPRMQQLAAEEKIEAYALPGGVIQHLIRETGAGRPGLITRVGLGTTMDPRQEGGRLNRRAQEALSEVLVLDGVEYLRYRPLRIDVALLRGRRADALGNVSFHGEPAELDSLVLAMAARNAGGHVLVQVREMVAKGTLGAMEVRIPGAWVNSIVHSPDQTWSHLGEPGNTTLAAAARTPESLPLERAIVAARGCLELRPDVVVSFGFGMPDGIAMQAARKPELSGLTPTLDHGHYGGHTLHGALFGFVPDALATIDSPSQFDFYSGGGIDIAVLGFGELDATGNVNVTRLERRSIGPGGFMDISHRARKLVFCGTFEARGLRLELHDAQLRIRQAGAVGKLVQKVAQVSFSGATALSNGQEVICITERAVFHFTPRGVVLSEIAPGIDLQRDVLDRMGFRPLLPPGGPAAMRAPPWFG